MLTKVSGLNFLSSLQVVDFGDCESLRDIGEIGADVRELYLRECRYIGMPPAVRKLRQLRVIDLSIVDLSSADAIDWSSFTTLRCLCLEMCRLSVVCGLDSLVNLVNLRVTNTFNSLLCDIHVASITKIAGLQLYLRTAEFVEFDELATRFGDSLTTG